MFFLGGYCLITESLTSPARASQNEAEQQVWGGGRSQGGVGPWGVRATQGSFSPQDHPIWFVTHLLLHRGGSKARRHAHDEFLPFITHRGKGLDAGPGASIDRNDTDIPDTSIMSSEKVLATSQCCVLSRRKNLSPKNYCSHLI